MADSVKTFQAHLTAVMDSLVRASVCEITKLFQDTVNDYLVEISLNRKENEALKLRLRLTENKLRNERKYGMGWAASRRAAGLLSSEDGGRKKRRLEVQRGKLGKEWSGGAWEEGAGGAGEQRRDTFLVQLPAGEEVEEEEEEEERRPTSREGKEAANIKEEDSYRSNSLGLLQEALQMSQAEPSPHGGLEHSTEPAATGGSGQNLPDSEEAWGVQPAEGPSGVSSGDELSGLETALKAEREREQAESGLGSPTPVVGAAGGVEYIGLDGLCSSQQGTSLRRGSPAAHRAAPGRSRRARETAGEAPLVLEQEPTEQLLPSATGSVEEEEDEESLEEAGDFLHFCSQCGSGFNTSTDLAEHACSVGEDRPYRCTACGRSFNHAWSLKNHECLQAAERPHSCELCGKRFTHSRSLERHQLVHTGERPHKCPQCGRSFSRLGNLERHQRIHTGERPYECGACGKRFSRVEYLKRHQNIHSGVRAERTALQCPQCSKNFGDAEQLEQHQCFYSI